jgi:hypothetical protein
VFPNENGGLTGFTLFPKADILDTAGSAFQTYDLKSPIGPITGPILLNASFPFPTDKGAFKINSAGNSTFTAPYRSRPRWLCLDWVWRV